MTSTTIDYEYRIKLAATKRFEPLRMIAGLAGVAYRWREKITKIPLQREQIQATDTVSGHQAAAIASYTKIIAEYPGMPEDHRERFLAAIARCCQEIRSEQVKSAVNF